MDFAMAAAQAVVGVGAVSLALRFLWSYWRHPDAVKMVDDFYDRHGEKLQLVEIRAGRYIRLLETGVEKGTGAPTILMIHGSCARMGQFNHQIEHFQKTHRVVAFDAVGCGRSPQHPDPKAYHPAELVEDAVEVCKQYCAGSRTVVVGHSFGTYVALHVAQRCRDAVSGGVLIGSRPMWEDGERLRRSLAIFTLPKSVLWFIRPVLGMGFAKLAIAPSTPASLRKQEAEASSRNTVHMFTSFWRQIHKVADHPPVLEEVVDTEFLLITGEHDKLTPPHLGEAVQQRLQKATLLRVQRASHQVMQEQPDEVNTHIEKFVSRVVSRKPATPP